MRQSYFPSTDAGLLAWARNFLAVVGSSSDYGISAGQLAELGALVQAYAACLVACDPGVRNKVAVIAKNQAASDLKSFVRPLVSIMRGQVGLSDSQRVKAGLTVPSARTVVPPPADPPRVTVTSVVGHRVTVRLTDSTVTGKRGRPKGAKGASVWSYVGQSAPEDTSLYKFEVSSSSTEVSILVPESVAPGSTVWLTARWYNQRGQTGPMAVPVYAVIQFGMAGAG